MNSLRRDYQKILNDNSLSIKHNLGGYTILFANRFFWNNFEFHNLLHELSK